MSSSDDESSSSSEEYDRKLREWKARLRDNFAANGAQYYDNRQSAEKRPLVERISNKWMDEKAHWDTEEIEYDQDDGPSYCHQKLNTCCEAFDIDDDNSCPNVTLELCMSRRFRRLLALLVLVTILLVVYWVKYLGPFLRADWVYKAGFVRQEEGTYGMAKGGHWRGHHRVQALASNSIPGGPHDSSREQRLIFVGDIHGCLDELLALLDKVGFKGGRDHLIATGDVISKGPDNVGVLDELIRLNATSVRGNHEDRILEAARLFSKDSPLEPPTVEESSGGYSKDARLLKSLKKHHLRYLEDMPLILRIPPLPAAKSQHKHAILNEILVVHAGLVPHLELDRQDPYYVMNMRSINFKTHSPSSTREGRSRKNKPWADLWNWYNDRLFKGRSLRGFRDIQLDAEYALPEGNGLYQAWQKITLDKHRPRPQVTIYGHDSHMGLQLHKWSKGLDSACVSGGKLTALILDAHGDTEIESVRCQNYKAWIE